MKRTGLRCDSFGARQGKEQAVFIGINQAKAQGKSVLVIDKRPNIAGNVFTEKIEGINVHKYGAHIFHTNNKKVWNFVNRFA